MKRTKSLERKAISFLVATLLIAASLAANAVVAQWEAEDGTGAGHVANWCGSCTNATKIELMAGEEDNFDPDPDTPPASPSPTLVAQQVTNSLPVGFDNLTTNREFMHTFEWQDCGNITKACLEVKLKALNTSGYELSTDRLNLLFSDDNYSIGYYIWEDTTPNGQEETILLDLSELPDADALITETISGSVNLLDMLNDYGYLDLRIQDDTSVDYARLILCCEQNPSISVEKKVSNDGGQTWHEEVNQCVCQNVLFQITVINDGNVALTNIVIADHLPNCLEYVSGPAVNGICPTLTSEPLYYNLPGTNTPTWTCSELFPGSSAQVTYTAHVVMSGICENQVSVEGECDGQIVHAEDSAVVTGEECEELCECSASETKIELMAGEEDNFDPDPDTPPASPSQTLEEQFGPGVGFDYPVVNKKFIHTFEWQDCGNITKACLEVKLKALGEIFSNDEFYLWFSDDNYHIGYKIWGETASTGQIETILLDLSGLPDAGDVITETISGSVNLLDMLNDEGYLDLYIQDDTSVDYANLILCCECECGEWEDITVTWTSPSGTPESWTGSCEDNMVQVPVIIALGTPIEIHTSITCEPSSCEPSYEWEVTEVGPGPDFSAVGTTLPVSFTPTATGWNSFEVLLSASCDNSPCGTCTLHMRVDPQLPDSCPECENEDRIIYVSSNATNTTWEDDSGQTQPVVEVNTPSGYTDLPLNPGCGAQWIWIGTDNQGYGYPVGTEELTTTFSIPQGYSVTTACLEISADDRADIMLNGQVVGSHEDLGGTASGWDDVSIISISPSLFTSGTNELQVTVEDVHGAYTAGIWCLQVCLVTQPPDSCPECENEDEIIYVSSNATNTTWEDDSGQTQPVVEVNTPSGYTDLPLNPGCGAQWIWIGTDNQGYGYPVGTEELTTTFSIPQGYSVTTACLEISADDRADIMLNGQVVGSHEGWDDVSIISISPSLFTSGTNELQVTVEDVHGAFTAGIWCLQVCLVKESGWCLGTILIALLLSSGLFLVSRKKT